MASHDYYYGSSYENHEKPLPSAPIESIYSEHPRKAAYAAAQRPVSPVTSQGSDPFASHSNLSSQQQRYATPSLHPNGSDIYHSHSDIALQSQPPKAPDGRSHYSPPGYPLQRQESDTFLIRQEEGESDRGRKKRRFDWTRIPWVCYIVTLIQLSVFIGELVKSSNLTGSPITKPSQNPMIGPPNTLLINMGARYVACMRNQKGVQDTGIQKFFCPNTTDITDPSWQHCTLEDLCGFQSTTPVPNPNPALGLNGPMPNQWFRFIVPIFMHGGFIHIASNLLLQLMIARDMEKVIGSIRFALVYFSSGIFGFVFGGNYAASGIASTGCSGSLFGIIGLVFLDLFYTWGDRDSPIFDLVVLLVTVVIQIVIGLLPTGLDNFSHIGGLLVGLVLGICLLHSPNALRKHLGASPRAYSRGHGKSSKQNRRKSQPVGTTMVVYGTTGTDASGFLKDPKNFFKDRKPLWWVWWIFRAAALLAIVIGFIVLIQNFYSNHESNCTWCKYMSCINHNNWCNRNDLTQTTTTPVPASQSGGARLML